MQSNWAFHCILSPSPASQRRRLTPCTWGYKEPMCAHSSFHIPQRAWGRAALLFFPSPVTNGHWQAPRKPEQELAELGWRQKCYMSIGLGDRGQKEVPPKAPSDGALALEKIISFSGDKQTSVSGMEGKFWQEGDKAWEDTMTGHRSLWTSISSQGLPGFNSIPANQVDNFCNRKIFPKVCFHEFSLKFQMNLLLMGTMISNAHLY